MHLRRIIACHTRLISVSMLSYPDGSDWKESDLLSECRRSALPNKHRAFACLKTTKIAALKTFRSDVYK